MIERLFDLWMDKNHPYFFIITGGIALLSYIGAVASVFLFIFDVGWWLKLATLSAIIWFWNRFISKAMLKNYVKEFKSGDKKL